MQGTGKMHVTKCSFFRIIHIHSNIKAVCSINKSFDLYFRWLILGYLEYKRLQHMKGVYVIGILILQILENAFLANKIHKFLCLSFRFVELIKTMKDLTKM